MFHLCKSSSGQRDLHVLLTSLRFRLLAKQVPARSGAIYKVHSVTGSNAACRAFVFEALNAVMIQNRHWTHSDLLLNTFWSLLAAVALITGNVGFSKLYCVPFWQGLWALVRDLEYCLGSCSLTNLRGDVTRFYPIIKKALSFLCMCYALRYACGCVPIPAIAGNP
jgi:hypothetical protein